MKQTITIQEVCPDCSGTGLYVGMAERDGAAIVCHKCKGSGCHEFVHTYAEFKERSERSGVKRVYQTNPGIVIGEGGTHTLDEFGGITYENWLAGGSFGHGTENRKYTCPAWWYQGADYKKKPDWSECMAALGGRFSECPSFCQKEDCWRRWDAEQT